MRITYHVPDGGSVTIESKQPIPRIGELVDASLVGDYGQKVAFNGRVRDVTWVLSDDSTKVSVFLQ